MRGDLFPMLRCPACRASFHTDDGLDLHLETAHGAAPRLGRAGPLMAASPAVVAGVRESEAAAGGGSAYVAAGGERA